VQREDMSVDTRKTWRSRQSATNRGRETSQTAPPARKAADGHVQQR
jgi:hypothetical protein